MFYTVLVLFSEITFVGAKMLIYTEKTITQKLDEAFDLNHILIDEEIENAISRHLDSGKEQWKKVHKRILSILNIHSEHDSKYYCYENFEILFRRTLTIAKLQNIQLLDLDSEFTFI